MKVLSNDNMLRRNRKKYIESDQKSINILRHALHIEHFIVQSVQYRRGIVFKK